MDDIIIKASRLTKKYRGAAALNNLSVALYDNNITGLIGRNGSGKTTFMKLCAGLLEKTSGGLLVFGESPADNLRVLSNLVYTCPDLQYKKNLRLDDIVRDYTIMYAAFDPDFAYKLLKFFDLKPNQKYDQLSRGMASIFNFICGLACRARLTMFDEPVLGMDVTVRKAVYDVLLREYAEHPRTIIVSSHLLSEIERILSDIVLIDDGRLILRDSVENLRQSAYMLDGDPASLKKFSEGKNVIWSKSGETGSAVVIYGKIEDAAIWEAHAAGLRLSAVRPDDLCVYLTSGYKEADLDCLWQKAK